MGKKIRQTKEEVGKHHGRSGVQQVAEGNTVERSGCNVMYGALMTIK